MPAPSDDERFAAFYAATFERVVRDLRPMVGSDAEDVSQEAFLVASRRWDVVAGLDRPDAWVRRVALRMGARRARRAHHGLRLEMASSPPVTTPAPDLDLAAAILGLSDRHAAAIRLHHLEDRPVAAVAELLGCSEGAAKVTLLRARRVLAERLSGLTGHWVSRRTWTVDAIAQHLASIGRAAATEAVIDRDLGGRGGRWELTVADGSYVLRRDDGVRFDHGASRVDGSSLELAPALATGRARYTAKVDGRHLTLRFAQATIPPYLGVPEGDWASLFYDSSPLVRASAG